MFSFVRTAEEIMFIARLDSLIKVPESVKTSKY